MDRVFIDKITFNDLKFWFYNQAKGLYTERESNNALKLLIEHFDSEGRSWAALIYNEAYLFNIQTLITDTILPRLTQNEPLAYIIGETCFYNLTFKVDSNVLIPRPETEELVDLIVDDWHSKAELGILDIGTGSGCIAIALAKTKKSWKVKAIDVSEKALMLANKNADLNKVAVDFKLSDILQNNIENCYDIIVSNPPYIGSDEKNRMSDSAINHEPHLALFTENDDPLQFYIRIGELSVNALKEGGKLYFELNEFYGEEIKKCLENMGYSVTLKTDLQGKNRMAICEQI